MNVVLDSNVWISALVFGGNPRRTLEFITELGHRIVLSPEIITEVRRILNQKFPDFILDFEALLGALAQRIEMVGLGSVTTNVSRDPADDMILETALVGRANYIISGDRDLLSLKSHESVRIITPAEAVELLSSESRKYR